MKFSTEFLNEIRARVPVSQVVGARVKLRKEGREWRGLSPFNAERTPSFFVNDQKQFYHDFSSGKHGDVFAFLVDVENLTFPEAVERLAGDGRARNAAPGRRKRGARQAAREPARSARARRRDLPATRCTIRSGPRRAAISPIAGSIRRPSARSASAIPRPRNSRCATRWRPRGSTARQMIEAGLLVHGEGIAVPYDRFQNRVMFPIHDRSGRVVAFGGRALDPGAKAKYLNSPETELFHKGSLLFNHHRARKAAHDKGQVIAVEGYVDVIAMTQAGFPADGRAARHRADGGPMRAALDHVRGADPVLRRRQGRPQGGLSRDRDRAAADRRRQEPAIRAAAGGAGPRRSRPRPAGRRRSAR